MTKKLIQTIALGAIITGLASCCSSPDAKPMPIPPQEVFPDK